MAEQQNDKTQGSAAASTKAPKTKKYRALRGIHTKDGKIAEGDICELTVEEARHFGKLKALGAYIPDEGSEDEDEE